MTFQVVSRLRMCGASPPLPVITKRKRNSPVNCLRRFVIVVRTFAHGGNPVTSFGRLRFVSLLRQGSRRGRVHTEAVYLVTYENK
jgi:hypothetical protein